MNWSEFFAMGGYASFVWPAYGIGLATFFANIWFARRRHQQLLSSIKRQQAQQQKEQPRADNDALEATGNPPRRIKQTPYLERDNLEGDK